jgi:hypothetical protein
VYVLDEDWLLDPATEPARVSIGHAGSVVVELGGDIVQRCAYGGRAVGPMMLE